MLFPSHAILLAKHGILSLIWTFTVWTENCFWACFHQKRLQLSDTSYYLWVSKYFVRAMHFPLICNCKMNGIILMFLKVCKEILLSPGFAYINDTFLFRRLCFPLEATEKLLFWWNQIFQFLSEVCSFYHHIAPPKSCLTLSPRAFYYYSSPFWRGNCYNKLSYNCFSPCKLKCSSPDLTCNLRLRWSLCLQNCLQLQWTRRK